MVIGKKPESLKGKIPTKRDFQHYFTLQNVNNPIHEAKRYKQVYDMLSIQTYSQVAKHLGVSRARVRQMLNLLKLPEDIIEYIESIEGPEAFRSFSERKLRKVLKSKDPIQAFWALV